MNGPAAGSKTVDALLAEGRRLFDAGLAADARELLGRAHAMAPEHEACARWLADAQMTDGALDEASDTIAAALIRAPAATELIVLQSEIALRRGALGTAEAILDAAIATAGTNATLLARRGHVHLLAGNARAANALLEQSLAIDPRNSAAHSTLILAASYDPAMTTARLKGLQRRWVGPQAPAPAFDTSDSDTTRPLRVGYVSSALNHHPAAKVFSAVLLHHDPAAVAVYCYATSRRRDWVSVRLRTAVAQWRSIAGLDDRQAVDLIRRDRIDILVDLDGHFPHNRLGVFSLRAAPIQVSAWGYAPGPGTPGIDYLFSDPVLIPPGEAAAFPEHIVTLPCAQPYNGDLMTRPAPPALAGRPDDEPVRFGCFNRYDKLSDEALTLWGEILHSCPGATLTLKDRFFGDAGPRERVRAALSRGGADPARILFETREAHPEYLAAYDRIDLALDPFPVNGGVTTLDGLFQGVPVVTLCGTEPSGRIGASILTALHLERCISHSAREYLDMAVALGRDALLRARLRADIRAATRLGGGWLRTYAASVEAAYRDLWNQYVGGRPRAGGETTA